MCIAGTLAKHQSENVDARMCVNGPDEKVIEGEAALVSDEVLQISDGLAPSSLNFLKNGGARINHNS